MIGVRVFEPANLRLLRPETTILGGPLLFGHIRFPTGGLLGALEYREEFKIKDKQQLKTSNVMAIRPTSSTNSCERELTKTSSSCPRERGVESEVFYERIEILVTV